MVPNENYYAVLLHDRRIGTLCQKGDHTRFTLNESYLSDPSRPVLGLRFEENLTRPYSAALRLPCWFSNLLPEGPLREWIADERGVSLAREMELLAQVGHDLPGAMQVLPASGPEEDWNWSANDLDLTPKSEADSITSPWRFSLAGVALKFSMLERGDRLTVPAGGEYGDWLVKFPDYRHADVPVNEFAMMSLARSAGINVPDIRLIHRDELGHVPDRMWPNLEEWAYAIRRFDRDPENSEKRIHIEDFAQVADKYPEQKYEGSFESVMALAYRGHDVHSLREAVRRLAFSVVIGNGDAHFKNWSLIYRNERIPTLSPAYDLVSTIPYSESVGETEDLGLKIGRSKRFESVSLSTFRALESRLDHRFGRTGSNLAEIANEVSARVSDNWGTVKAILDRSPLIASAISKWIDRHALH